MKAEQLLEISAKRNMREWNLSTFKKTHPHLFKTIIQAIDSAKKPMPVFIEENEKQEIKFEMNKKIISQQLNEEFNPIVDLIDGDIVELKEDGIYFTRKIGISEMPIENKERLLNIFKQLKGETK